MASPKVPSSSPPNQMELLVNERGEALVVHDRPLSGTPEWAEYDRSARRLAILFEDGTSLDVGFAIDPSMDEYLQNAKTLLLVRMENMKPAEGYDLRLVVRE